ncbi:MAG TPA: hypothetical protein PKY25_02455 [Bacilli bacterium]|nr:hypothetical protein [Bacilli bacterium]
MTNLAIETKATTKIFGIVDGKEVAKEVDLSKCKICEILELLKFAEGTDSHTYLLGIFFSMIDNKLNPVLVAQSKRLIKKMRGEKAISKKDSFEE